jgi:putative peptidoglycan lipid II flippase
MTLALLPSLRAVRFRYRPRLDLRHPGLRTAMRLAGWTLLYVLVSQLGYLMVVNLATATTAYTIYTYAYQVFQLPYAVIGVSVITALLPRMSSHAADGRRELVREDLSTASRMAIAAIVPAALCLVALGRPIAVAVFNHGAVSHSQALAIGDALSTFAVALVPFSLYQVQLRVFYANQDSRTPALINIGVVATNIAAAFALSALLPLRHRAVALALAFTVAYLAGLAVSTILLRVRLGGVDANRTARVLTRVTIVAGLGAVVAAEVALGTRNLIGAGWFGSAVGVLLACAAGLGVFLVLAMRMGPPEVRALTRAVGARFGPSRRT